MSTVSITFRTDAEAKKQAEDIFAQMGLNMTTALNAFIKATVQKGKMPFELVSDAYARNETIDRLLLESLEYANNPNAIRYTGEETSRKARKMLDAKISG